MWAGNPFLEAEDHSKGGGLYVEDPSAVENFACQTAGSAPDAFESRLADVLMAVFAAGIWELDRVVVELNTRGCHDTGGLPWTVAAFQAQLARSASRLFAVKKERAHG
jgi:hypothetical protein